MRLSLLWDVMQLRMVVSYRRFGTAYRPHLQGSVSPKKSCTETSITKFQPAILNIPEERMFFYKQRDSLEELRLYLTL